MQRSDEQYDLYEHGYRFAIHKIDPRLGRIQIQQGYQDKTGKRDKIDIKMVSCDELYKRGDTDTIFNEKYRENIDEAKFKMEDYLCPDKPELIVQGNFHNEQFQYIKISVLGCDENEVADCAPLTHEAFEDVAIELVQNNAVVQLVDIDGIDEATDKDKVIWRFKDSKSYF